MRQDDPPEWCPPDDLDRVVVSCTARRHGGGPRRLPDRADAHGVLAGVLVEDEADAEAVLRALDRPGRTLFVDVERKQPADLMAVAVTTVRQARVLPTKPNDTTVRSLDVVVTALVGADLRSTTCGVVGTGNLGFKSTLLLAERGARVLVAGRSPSAVTRTVSAVGAILPRYSDRGVGEWQEERVGLLVSTVSARGVVDRSWVGRLAPGALVVDVGIDTLTPDFVADAATAGHRVMRLDTRAAEAQVVLPAPGFLDGALGSAELAGVPVVSGGVLPARGVVVVDNVSNPRRALGVASGAGGLLAAEALTPDEQERMRRVEHELHDRQARP